MNWDIAVFRLINDLAGSSQLTDFIFVFLAEFLLMIVLIINFILLFKKKFRLTSLKAILAFIVSYILTYTIAVFYFKARPFADLDSVNQLITTFTDKGFPSGHSLSSASLAVVWFENNKKLALIFLISALLIGFARIYVGVHFPTDVLTGIILGVILGIIIKKLPLRQLTLRDVFYKSN